MLDDFNLYDIELNRWLEVEVFMDGKIVKPEAQYKTNAVIGSEQFEMKKVGAR